MKTYAKVIDGDEVIVTDSLIVAKYFEIEHKHILRTIRRIVDIKRDTPINGRISFVKETYKDVSNRAKTRYILNEPTFYKLLMNIKSRSKLGAEKLDIIQDDFIDEFFRLREQNKRLVRLGRIFIKYFAPIDELGNISFFNGKKRAYAVRGYLTSTKNGRPLSKEDEQVMVDGFLSEDILEETIKTVNRHEGNKKRLQKTKYIPSALYLLLKEKGSKLLKSFPYIKSFQF